MCERISALTLLQAMTPPPLWPLFYTNASSSQTPNRHSCPSPSSTACKKLHLTPIRLAACFFQDPLTALRQSRLQRFNASNTHTLLILFNLYLTKRKSNSLFFFAQTFTLLSPATLLSSSRNVFPKSDRILHSRSSDFEKHKLPPCSGTAVTHNTRKENQRAVKHAWLDTLCEMYTNTDLIILCGHTDLILQWVGSRAERVKVIKNNLRSKCKPQLLVEIPRFIMVTPSNNVLMISLI